MPVTTLNVTGPIAAVEDLVCRQWTDWNQHRRLQVRPTFAVSPNAEYFGRRVLGNRQVVHHSLATNVLRVFPAAEGSGMPYTLACHEFTVHLAAPTTLTEVWRLECPYPADERLHEAVIGMVPPGIDLGFDVAFPTHATEMAPDMLPLMERLQLNQSSEDDDAAVDNLYGQQNASVAPRDTFINSPLSAATGCRTSGYGMEACAPRTMDLGLEDGELLDSDSGGMPELVSEDESVNLGLCPFCLGGAHTANLDCPSNATHFSENEITAIHALNSLASDTTALPEMVSDMRRALDSMRSSMTTEWVAPAALRPSETPAAVRDMLERFTTEYDQELAARREPVEHRAMREFEEEFRGTPLSTATDRIRTETPFPHAFLPLTTALMSRPTPPSSNRPSFIVMDTSWIASSGRVPRPPTPALVTAVTREWSPAVTEWSVEVPEFMFTPTWIIDEAVDRALNAVVAEPPATASVTSSTNATPSSNGEDNSNESESRRASFHRLPRFTFQPGNPEDIQLALYFWAYDGALKQLDARRFEDDFGSEPAEKVLRILHGPLHRLVDYTAMAAEGVQHLQEQASPPAHPLSSIFEHSVTSDDSPDSFCSPTSLDYSLPTHTPMRSTRSTTPSTLLSLVACSGYLPIEDNHSAEPIKPTESDPESDERGDATRIGVGIDLHRVSGGASSPSSDCKRKNPDGDTDGEFQQGHRQRVFGKFRGDDLRKNTIELEAFKAAAARAVATASPDDIRYLGRIRLAILAMSHFLEEVCWRLYGIDENTFPDKYPRHPLLYDIEAAKVQTLWAILHRHGHERLANNLHELLSIRLRGDIAGIHTLDAKYLDERYPEQDARYWDLLRDPYAAPVTRPQFVARMDYDTSESDESDDEEMQLGYPDSEHHSTDEEMEMPVRQWIHAAPNYYSRTPPYTVRPDVFDVNRGGIPHSI
ncbi:hypothetical protein K438DRAFT_1958360 [Mycena galopus ATCC 62051]|nr:hypothetical protein K438DRAFT_1958360 [Mycena galopus ATCC 62051]